MRPPPDPRDALDAPGRDELAAFRELHGPSLHGFALLLTLGDAGEAGRLAAGALAAAAPLDDELRHPERAAARLRRWATERAARRPAALDAEERLSTLHELGIDGRLLAGLARLDLDERAALVAVTVEGLDPRDVGTIVRRSPARLDALLERARARFLDGYAAARGGGTAGGGRLDRAVRDAAASVLS